MGLNTDRQRPCTLGAGGRRPDGGRRLDGCWLGSSRAYQPAWQGAGGLCRPAGGCCVAHPSGIRRSVGVHAVGPGGCCCCHIGNSATRGGGRRGCCDPIWHGACGSHRLVTQHTAQGPEAAVEGSTAGDAAAKGTVLVAVAPHGEGDVLRLRWGAVAAPVGRGKGAGDWW